MTTLQETRLRAVASEWWLAGATIFFGAFFLFEVEPLIAKAILPWFGGSAQVWTTCLLFFQGALLLGYLYAHLLSERVAPQWQVRVHVGLLVVSLALLPIFPAERFKPAGSEDPLLLILGLLAATIGLPFVLLSATNPLVQSWLARRERVGGMARPPYQLFALSNFGSMLALLSYPLLVEPNLTLAHQTWSWSFGYAGFVVLCSATAWHYRSSGTAIAAETSDAGGEAPSWTERVLWFALAAAPSALLLGLTNYMLQNIAAIPLFWLLPLALYLLSFICAFGSLRWYSRPIWYELVAGALVTMMVAMSGYGTLNNIYFIPIPLAALFICCMVCHAELASLRPKPRRLTSYYLTISAGGAAGGLFVSAVAPAIFNAMLEVALIAPATGVLVIIAAWRQCKDALTRTQRGIFFGGAVVLLCAVSGYLANFLVRDLSGNVLLARNFYGALRVTDYPGETPDTELRKLINGSIDHGQEFTAPEKRREPLTYYPPSSGVGLVLTELAKDGPLKVGVVGLGTGTIAGYCRAGDTYRFYEINPLVIEIAQKNFFYLKSCPAPPALIVGDARLSLEQEPAQGFDVLAVDAFISDAIPMHLLTREAMALYWRHLKPDGVLAVHISNAYVDLAPVVAAAAIADGKEARTIFDTSSERGLHPSNWVLVTARGELFQRPALISANPIEIPPDFRPWTDDYSNLWRLFRLHS